MSIFRQDGDQPTKWLVPFEVQRFIYKGVCHGLGKYKTEQELRRKLGTREGRKKLGIRRGDYDKYSLQMVTEIADRICQERNKGQTNFEGEHWNNVTTTRVRRNPTNVPPPGTHKPAQGAHDSDDSDVSLLPKRRHMTHQSQTASSDSYRRDRSSSPQASGAGSFYSSYTYPQEEYVPPKDPHQTASSGYVRRYGLPPKNYGDYRIRDVSKYSQSTSFGHRTKVPAPPQQQSRLPAGAIRNDHIPVWGQARAKSQSQGIQPFSYNPRRKPAWEIAAEAKARAEAEAQAKEKAKAEAEAEAEIRAASQGAQSVSARRRIPEGYEISKRAKPWEKKN